MDCNTDSIAATPDQTLPRASMPEVFDEMFRSPGTGAGVCWTALLDELAFGLAVTEADGRLLFANRVACCELERGTSLRHVKGFVKAVQPRTDEFLGAAIARAGGGRRGYVNLATVDGAFGCAVVPVPGIADGQTSRVALILERRMAHCELGYHFFSQAHGLTPVEHRVLVTLARGIGVQEVSSSLGSAVSTVRTHVRNLLFKTGQRSLRALVARLGAIPPVGARVVN